MKKLLLLVTCILSLSFTDQAFGQTVPVWFKDINAFPDSSSVFPVRIFNDGSNNVYVLSTYSKGTGPLTKYKIYLGKYDAAGLPAWNIIFDNGGTGQPRAFDMAVDAAGNCFVAGGLMAAPAFKPLLLKVSTSGSIVWQRDSTTTFDTGYYNKIILSNSKLYLAGTTGMARFDVNGNEVWSNNSIASIMETDHADQVIFASTDTLGHTIFRCDSSGAINFSDSSIVAERIAADAANSFYLLSSNPQYELVKYDSSGTLKWSYNAFPVPPGFGDIGMEIITDMNNDVIVAGLNDTMYKFTPAGNIVWTKSMGGLDAYKLTVKITSNNILAIGGTVPGGNGYDMYVSWFDLNGVQNWAGHYSSNDSLTEFTQDMCIDNSGVYAVENNDNRTTFVKFESPFVNAVIDYSVVCIDSVWYDNGNHNYYNVRVYNGNIASIMHPSVRMVSVFWDTTGNPYGNVSIPVHLGNSYQVYHDSITDQFITVFDTGYTFYVEENFGATRNQVSWCATVGINEISEPEVRVFPNPVEHELFIRNGTLQNNIRVTIYNSVGQKVYDRMLPPDPVTRIDFSRWMKGIYSIRVQVGKQIRKGRFVKM